LNFTTADKVLSVIRQGDEIARIQSNNRRKVNDLFNGVASPSEEEAKKAGIHVRVNWGEAARIAQHGSRQYKAAFLGPKNFFRVKLRNAPVEKQTAWEIFITNEINRPMKKSKKYIHTHKYKWMSVLLHGLGPTLWYDKENWCPDYIALADLRIPTDTTTDFENLNWFAVRHAYTVYSLAKKCWGENADPHWQKVLVAKLLASKANINYDNANSYDWGTQPEKMAELVKQNGMYYDSDAVPTIPLWHFYYLNDTKTTEAPWNMTVVPDVLSGATAVGTDKFLYENPAPIADELPHLLQCQFGDLNVDAPFKYHAVRALGFELMDPCFYSNLTRCRFLQHVHESFNIWLKVSDPAGRARAQKIELYDRCIIPEGVSIVPQDQRHQIRPEMVEGAMQELRQLMAESSTAYTQDIHEPGDERETATKTLSKEHLANALLGGLLDEALSQEVPSYEEISRRFCIRKSSNNDAQKFQKACARFGIPPEFVNIDQWDIEPEVPLGNGNQSLALGIANQMLAISPRLSPTAQQEINHEYIEVVTQNPRKADRLAPLNDAKKATPAQKVAEADFGILIRGLPANVLEVAVVEQIPVLLGLLAGEITLLEQSGNVADQRGIIGLKNVAAHTKELIAMLEPDLSQRQNIKIFSDTLGKLENSIKGFEQRLSEAQGKQGEDAPISIAYKDLPPSVQRQVEAREGFQPATEVEAQVDPKTLKATHSMAVKDAGAQQKQEHQQVAFDKEQARKDYEAAAQIEREHAMAAAEIERQKKISEAAPKEPSTPKE